MSAEQAPVIFMWQVRSDAPSIVKDCLNAWKEGVALDIHTRRLFDRHARCADKNPYIWFCPPSPEEALKTSWESLLERYHQNLSRTECWYHHDHDIKIRLSMADVTQNILTVMGFDAIYASLTEFPVLLRINPAFRPLCDRCKVELHNDVLQQKHSISIRDLKRLTSYHKLASEITTLAAAEKRESICNFFYIGSLLTNENDPAKLAILLRFLKNSSTSKLRSHLSTKNQAAFPFELADFMHIPDSQTHPSGNWLIVFKSGKMTVRRHRSYKDCRQIYSVEYKRMRAAGDILLNYNGRFYQTVYNFCNNYKGLKSRTSASRQHVENTVFPPSACLVVPGRNRKKYKYIAADGEYGTQDVADLESEAYLLDKGIRPTGAHLMLVWCEELKRAATSALLQSKKRKC